MLEIEMSKDIKNFEPKILGPFTLRQLICVGISVTYGVPLFFILGGDIVIRILITILAMLPVLLCGWLKVFDEPFERFLKIIVVNKFLKPAKRKYKISNQYKIEEQKIEIKKVKRSKIEKGWK